jgi:ribosomal protein L29
MNSQDIQPKIDELKMEYIRIQGDIEKLESTGHSIEKLEARLIDIEEELSNYRSQLSK